MRVHEITTVADRWFEIRENDAGLFEVSSNAGGFENGAVPFYTLSIARQMVADLAAVSTN